MHDACLNIPFYQMICRTAIQLILDLKSNGCIRGYELPNDTKVRAARLQHPQNYAQLCCAWSICDDEGLLSNSNLKTAPLCFQAAIYEETSSDEQARARLASKAILKKYGHGKALALNNNGQLISSSGGSCKVFLVAAYSTCYTILFFYVCGGRRDSIFMTGLGGI